jgi:hypothetical protein
MQVRRFGLIAITTLSLSMAFSSIAQARELTVTGSNGRTSTVNTDRQKTDNGFTFERNVTLPNGRAYNQSGNYTRTGNGGYERDAVWTGLQGRQTTINGTGTYDNGVINGSSTVTSPNGQSRTNKFQSQP